jgi:hypothetical protein
MDSLAVPYQLGPSVKEVKVEGREAEKSGGRLPRKIELLI